MNGGPKNGNYHYFYSRASCEARHASPQGPNGQCNFYSRASCEARRGWFNTLNDVRMISTHAPRVRRDLFEAQEMAENLGYISTHAPRVRRDLNDFCASLIFINFYSRASCEARLKARAKALAEEDFYSRASCEARRATIYTGNAGTTFLLTRLV